MFCRYLILITLFCALQIVYGEEGSVWSIWNKENNIKYGIISHPPGLRHSDAERLCISKHFHNVVTVRGQQESNELENTIHNYRQDQILRDGKLKDLQHSAYWVGTHRLTSSKWRHYDRQALRFDNWQSGFPRTDLKRLCSVGVWKCSGVPQKCFLKLQDRGCGQTKDIHRTVCERREKRIPIDSVEKKMREIPHVGSRTNHSENIARDLYISTLQHELSDDVVERGIKVLKNLTRENKNVSVPEDLMDYVLRTASAYQDHAFKNNSKVSREDRQSVVQNMEILMNNVKISRNKTTKKFITDSILAEIHYLDSNAKPEDYAFSFNQSSSTKTSLTVSSEVVARYRNNFGVGNKSRLSFVKFSSSRFFASEHNSPQVLSAQINGQAVEGLASPITYVIPPDPSSNGRNIPFVQCAAWDFNASSWSSRGCWLQTRNSTPVCACNHMTNFALLVELAQRPFDAIFGTINLVLGSLSCIGFIMTALIYMSFEKLRNSKPGPVHINLCCCYAMAYIVFLSGTDNQEDDLTCLAVTVLSHYFFLVSWFWTFIEALTLYQLVVKRKTSLDEKYFARVSLFSYLVPLVVVIITVGLTVGYEDRKAQNGFFRLNENFLYNSTYVSNYACWLTSYSLYFGFLAIGGILLIMNITIYVIVVRAITWSRRKINSTRKHSSTETFYQVVTIGLLTGLIWILAIPVELLAMSPPLVRPVSYVFSIVVALQGVIIFYLLCIHHKRARRFWFDPCWGRLKKYLCLIFCCRRITVTDRLKGSKRYSLERKTMSTTFEHQQTAVTTIAYSSQNHLEHSKDEEDKENHSISK